MSFTKTIKDELLKKEHEQSCCQYAELAGIVGYAGVVLQEKGDFIIKASTENAALARRLITLSRRLFGCTVNVQIKQHKNEKAFHNYVIRLSGAGDMLRSIGMLSGASPAFRVPTEFASYDCCSGAYIKGAFLGGGSIANPEKRYHLEFVTGHYLLSRDFKEIFVKFGITAKTVERKSNYVTYFKDSETICDVLAAMGAHNAVMSIYNVKILKEVKNQVNRVNNFEKANIDKMVNAYLYQAEAIRKIDREMGLENLPRHLQQVAALRLANTDASLQELGQMLSPPVGKSCINHRLRSIMKIADKME